MVKASLDGPEVAHVFFADDLIPFEDAFKEQANVIEDILRKYLLLKWPKS